ncbi:pip [Symbiodinium natans]|uniref:Pip protein n=1 Tax=Symbiodinium natans TaxID=878477 RepID=A0A812UBJ5_9DINO|nr:pip [Symbiodinium natans]
MRDSPDAFAATLETEESHPAEKWLERIQQGLVLSCGSSGCDLGFVWAVQRQGAVTLGLWVAPASRRRGIGGALLDAAIGWARDVGASKLLLNVADGNEAAMRLYESKGLQRTGSTGALPPPRHHIVKHQFLLEL